MTNLPKERIFKVEGMTCGHCQKAVEAAIGQLDGVSISSGRLESWRSKSRRPCQRSDSYRSGRRRWLRSDSDLPLANNSLD